MKRIGAMGSLMAIASVLFVAPATAQANYFKLQTRFQAPENKCFEGNRFAPESPLEGGAYMDDCEDVTGQYWKAVPTGNGYFVLKTEYQGDTKCLEGNRYAPDAILQGAAFMDDCQNVTGQMWRAVPVGDGYFRLKTQYQGNDKCLEGNRFHPDYPLGGAAFMDDCQNVTGQMWKVLGGKLVRGIPKAHAAPSKSKRRP